MPGKFVLPIFFAVVFLGAALLGPLIYFALPTAWGVPFHRAMARALMICALAAVGLNGRRIEWKRLWPWGGGGWKLVLLGLLIAAVSMQAMVGLDLAAAGFSSAQLGAGKTWGRVILALAAAIIVAPTEETIFRGFLQQELVRSLGWRAGWLLAAAVYAMAHFLKVPVELDHQTVYSWSGVSAMGAAFAHMGHDLTVPENLAKAANLFLIGLILGGTFRRSGSLWLNAGLHGGWVFGLLLFTGLTRPEQPPRISFLSGDILSSWATTLVLIILGLWLWRFYRHPSVWPETGASVR